MHRLLFLVPLGLLAFVAIPVAGEDAREDLTLTLRSRVKAFKNGDEWEELTFQKSFVPKETAIIICDMWDRHWCSTANSRCGKLAEKMVPVLAAARKRGIQVIHAPSECMDYYKDTPQRKRILAVKKVEPPRPLDITEPKLPIDDSDGGCDDGGESKTFKAWNRQNPAIPIADEDVISDNGGEVYSFLKDKGIKNLLVMGVHTNMCVLNRTFAIKQMTRWGVRCVLVRDLTDSMYNPKKPPFVTHAEGTELVVQHIEKYWCPSVLSADLVPAGKAGR